MTIAKLYITDTYGGCISYFRMINFDDNLYQEVKVLRNGRNKIVKTPYMVQFDTMNPFLMRKYNKLTDEDMGFILTQLYCEWRFKL